MERAPDTHATPEREIAALRDENAWLRAQLVAAQQAALVPRVTVTPSRRRRWLGRGIQLLLVLVGVAAGVLYMTYSDADFARGARDGYRDAARP